MCIYLDDSDELHYDSAEHIIPAGLGGIMKLPYEYVSREFNNLSSRFELALMRSSILSLPRQLLGPGKRGSLSVNKATKSKVGVLTPFPENGSYTLGYIELGKPFEIPHISLDIETGAFSINMNKGATEAEFQSFKRSLFEFEKQKVRLMEFPDLPSNVVLIGLQKGIETNFNCFIATQDGLTHPFNNKLLCELISSIDSLADLSNSERYHVRVHNKVSVNDDYYKCCAKIAFNLLAYLKGNSFVSKTDFNKLRKWVVDGGENNFVHAMPNYQSIGVFPQDSHQIIITQNKNLLIADVCFYNHFHNSVILSDSFTEEFRLDGFICDWRAMKEYALYDYLNRR